MLDSEEYSLEANRHGPDGGGLKPTDRPVRLGPLRFLRLDREFMDLEAIFTQLGGCMELASGLPIMACYFQYYPDQPWPSPRATPPSPRRRGSYFRPCRGDMDDTISEYFHCHGADTDPSQWLHEPHAIRASGAPGLRVYDAGCSYS